MQISSPVAPPTVAPAPGVKVAQRFDAHFAAFGVDEVVPSGANEVTLKFDQKSGFEHAIATAAINGSIDGVKLLFELAEGANVPRMLPGAQHLASTYAKLPGVTGVDVAETFPEQVSISVDGRTSASDAVTLLKDKLPGGATVSVQVAGAGPDDRPVTAGGWIPPNTAPQAGEPDPA